MAAAGSVVVVSVVGEGAIAVVLASAFVAVRDKGWLSITVAFLVGRVAFMVDGMERVVERMGGAP